MQEVISILLNEGSACVGERRLLHCHPVVRRTHLGKKKRWGEVGGGKLGEEVRREEKYIFGFLFR